jgi:antitoxin ParD1/3/4
MSADLGEKLAAVVNDLVANGLYNSKSEVLREGVRLVQEREAALVELAEGSSSPGGPDG